MSINLVNLVNTLKSTGYPVYRSKAPKEAKYPYIVYSYISTGKKMTSGKLFKKMPLYQVALFTKGTERDLIPIEKEFNKNHVIYSDFMSTAGDENDDIVTNFFTQIRTVENGE